MIVPSLNWSPPGWRDVFRLSQLVRSERPQQAERALDMGLSLVAVGQGLVINPNWIELSKSGNGNLIEAELRTTKIPEIALPTKLWDRIQVATGWFKINDDLEAQRQKAAA